MPFVRFSRDKRGYEHTYLIHAAQKKGAPARVLYWYRTPPGVKVGRPAFDDDVKRALEAQYPLIAFDWSTLLSVTIPPVEVEHWRERRRAEKAAKQARQAAVRDDAPEDDEPSPETASGELDVRAAAPSEPSARRPRESPRGGRPPTPPSPEPLHQPGTEQAGAHPGHRRPDDSPDAGGDAADDEDETADTDGEPTVPGELTAGADRPESPGPAGAASTVRKRRRRGGRRRRRGPGQPAEGQATPPAAPPGGSEPSE